MAFNQSPYMCATSCSRQSMRAITTHSDPPKRSFRSPSVLCIFKNLAEFELVRPSQDEGSWLRCRGAVFVSMPRPATLSASFILTSARKSPAKLAALPNLPLPLNWGSISVTHASVSCHNKIVSRTYRKQTPRQCPTKSPRCLYLLKSAVRNTQIR